jgi:LacI family transcriptional regulator
MAVRLKDIARDLGVSVVTVSKVLRNHTDISEETRERVLKRMKELNYRPNLAARALVTGRSCTIGLVVPDLVHPFFSHVAKGVSKVLRTKGYSLFISSSEEDPQLEHQEIEQMLARRVDALIIASAQWTVESFRRIEEQKVPYVLIDRQFAGLAANFIGVDDIAVGRIATEHLLDQGCTRIAHLRGPEVSPALGRLEGYRGALAKQGLFPAPGHIVMSRTADDSGDISGYEAMLKLLELKPRPDGVFCYNDPTALGAMKAIFDAGLRVPDDIAIVGCGNVIYDTLLRVPLSSVDQDSLSIGENAGTLALSLVGLNTVPQPKSVLLEPNLVVRASSRRRAL